MNDSEDQYSNLIYENREMSHEIQVLRSVIQHIVNKHGIEEPKVNNIPVSEWKGSMSLHTYGGENE